MSVVSASSLTSAINFISGVGKISNNVCERKVPTDYKIVKKGELKARLNSKRAELVSNEEQFAEQHTVEELKELQKKHAADIASLENKLEKSKIVIDETIFNKDEDPELFGLIHALETRKSVEARNVYIKQYFKKLNYGTKPPVNILIQAFCSEVPEIKPKFSVKIFNRIFGKYTTANDHQMSLIRYVPHMEGVLKNYFKGVSIEKFIEAIVKKEIQNPQLSAFVLQNYASETTDWLKKHEHRAEIEQVLALIKSTKSFYEILDKYDKSVITQENVEKFAAKAKELDMIVENARCVKPTFEEFIVKYINVLRALKAIDERPAIREAKDGKQVKVVRFDEEFVKSIKSKSPFKLTKLVKTKIAHCVDNNVDPVIVEKEYLPLVGKQKVKKEKERAIHEFIIEDFDLDLINIENFDKYVTFDKKVPKVERLACGVRLVKYIIDQTTIIQSMNKGNHGIQINIEY